MSEYLSSVGSRDGADSRAGAPTVAVWRHDWLPPSETFIRGQVDALARWSPHRMGYNRTQDPLAEPDFTVFGPTRRGQVERRYVGGLLRGRSVVAELDRISADLLHCHFGSNGVSLLPTLKRIDVPLVVTFHGYDATSLSARSDRAARRYQARLPELFDRAQLIIAVSQFIRERLLILGAPAEKTVVHHIGVETAQPGTAACRPQRASSPRLAFVGRLVEKKGLSDLLSAVAMLAQPLRSTPIDVVGYGPLAQILSDQANALGLNVQFHGACSPMEVRRILAGCTALCVPSKRAGDGDCEGLGQVVLESAAHFRPVVGYAHGGIPEAVQHGATGLLCAEGDVVELANNIRRILTDQPLATELGRAGRLYVARNFDVTAQTSKLEDLYDRVTGRPSVAAAYSAVAGPRDLRNAEDFSTNVEASARTNRTSDRRSP